ncbi:MAG: CDP-glycerol glycerophosphotransferase family protein [Eubacteriales bacterium]
MSTDVIRIILVITYWLFHKFPVKNKIVFASNNAAVLQGNMKYIYDEWSASGGNNKVKLLLYESRNTTIGKMKHLIHMIKSVYHLSTSKYFIVDDYYYPIYVIKPKKQVCIIQVWHACGAFKKFGYSLMDKSYGATKEFVQKVKIHSNYNYALVSSENVADIYSNAFHMDKKRIISIGIPRTDIFFNKDKIEGIQKNLYEKYPQLKGSKVILFAPTFRGDSKFRASSDYLPDFYKLFAALKSEYKIIIKLHPFVSKEFAVVPEMQDFIIDLSSYEDINELMFISELLITDYSSVIFEYALLEKPMIFYAPDLNTYLHERDFYYDYEEFVPGPITKDTQGLIKIIKNGSYDLRRITLFKNEFFDYQDGKSSQRFVKMLLNQIDGGCNE